MKKSLVLVILGCLSACSELTYQQYAGVPRQNSEVSILRLWTPTATNVFDSPGLVVQKIDGVEPGPYGRVSHAYLEPGEHELLVKYIQVKGNTLVCGALCDAIFNKPKAVKVKTEAGHTYILKYVNDKDGAVILDDKGSNYDQNCLKAREYAKGKNC